VEWAGLATPIGCVLYLIIAFSRGWLVSGREMDRHEKIWEARLVEAHEREALAIRIAETSEEIRRDVADQLRIRQIVDEVVVKTLAPPAAAEGAPSA
jgi:hypothetical protein